MYALISLFICCPVKFRALAMTPDLRVLNESMDIFVRVSICPTSVTFASVVYCRLNSERPVLF